MKIGINGFGRIGRCVLRAWQKHPDLEIALINDPGDSEGLAHLLQYDSIHGRFPEEVSATQHELRVSNRSIPLTHEKDPAQIPWKQYGVHLVLECTGVFTEASKAKAHIDGGGAKKVLISAPAKGHDITLVLGVNHTNYVPNKHHILSNASCTTYCLAPVAKALMESFGIAYGMMTTIHSYTNDQRLLDLSHKDLRRSRAAALSMIPTTTGAAKALSEVLPSLAGKMDGYALRVPTPNVSLVDLTVRLERPASASQINEALTKASNNPSYMGVLAVSNKPLVSTDYNGDPHAATVDLLSTQTVGDLAKVLAWYDNEMGYATHLYEMAKFLLQKDAGAGL